jgi:hypothetical protein
MDKTIDEIFTQLLRVNETESGKEISRLLVTLNYLLPGIFQQALDLVELHKVVRKDSALRKGAGRDSNNLLLEGVFTRHEATFTHDEKAIWTVQPFIIEKRGTFKPAPLQGTSFGYVVDLDLWHCSCQEFAKSKYTSSDFGNDMNGQLSNLELINHSRSGWGGTIHFGMSPQTFRVPTCVHIVAVFVFSKGWKLFSWMEQSKSDPISTGSDAEELLFVDQFTSKQVSSVEEWLVLSSL